MVWKDFMGRVLQEGDDILVAVRSRLHAGIVISIEDSILRFSYNWFESGTEYEASVKRESDSDVEVLDDVFILDRK